MKDDKNSSLFLLAGVVALIIGIVFSSALVHAPKTGSVEVESVPPIPASFPDVKNDTTYSNFLNKNALDPTQALQLGNSNSSPFSGAQ